MAENLNQTPNANRVHIGFFGMRNAGKSSLVNAVTGQSLSIVSDVKGTTTDPVQKAMELLPLGPVVVIDTPGLDDEGELGELRVKKAWQILNKCDIAVLAVDGAVGFKEQDKALLAHIRAKKIPFLVVYTKSDLQETAENPAQGNLEADIKYMDEADKTDRTDKTDKTDEADKTDNADKAVYPDIVHIAVSARTGENINALKERIAALLKDMDAGRRICGDFIREEDLVILVTPIDESAPKGRMILPQVQTIRDILDSRAVCLVTQTEQLPAMLAALKRPPRLVVTDSQAFETVKDMVPESIPLTSFSILMARVKGVLETAALGAGSINRLKDGDTVLISEGCTHHRQCKDIGTVKLPGWLEGYTGKSLKFVFTSGTEFPEDLSPYALVIHCGGCMLNEREVSYRQKCAEDQGVPFTNYGTVIAYMNGILKRSLELFPDLAERL